MKKKLVRKIILNVLLLLGIVVFIYMGITFSINLPQYIEIAIKYDDPYFKKTITRSIITIIASFLSAVIDIIFLVIIDRNEMTYLCSSTLKEYREHKEVTKEEQKKKKIEALEKELQDLKKDER